jgi:uncharacterized membrane protein
MKKQTTVIVLGALLSLAMTAPSFAQGKAHPRGRAPSAYSGYYDSALPEGNYTTYPETYSGGGYSGDIGGIGR